MRTTGHVLLTVGSVCLLLTVCQMIGAFDSDIRPATRLAERIEASLGLAVIGGLALMAGTVTVLTELLCRCCRRSNAGSRGVALHPTISSTERW